VEENQYKLCVEILKRLDSVGVLDKIILIGSWCIPLYEQHFAASDFTAPLRTRDIDFLIPFPNKIKGKIDVPALLKDLGYVVGFKGTYGFIQLEHPTLMVEFLVPEKGKGTDKPFSLPQLGLNAQTLRFLNLLSTKTITVFFERIPVILPHPAPYALHKLLIAQRRGRKEKALKDKRDAISVIRNIFDNKEEESLLEVFKALPGKWQSMILKSLKEEKENKMLDLLQVNKIR
jgi:hypothetical protein